MYRSMRGATKRSERVFCVYERRLRIRSPWRTDSASARASLNKIPSTPNHTPLSASHRVASGRRAQGVPLETQKFWATRPKSPRPRSRSTTASPPMSARHRQTASRLGDPQPALRRLQIFAPSANRHSSSYRFTDNDTYDLPRILGFQP